MQYKVNNNNYFFFWGGGVVPAFLRWNQLVVSINVPAYKSSLHFSAKGDVKKANLKDFSAKGDVKSKFEGWK